FDLSSAMSNQKAAADKLVDYFTADGLTVANATTIIDRAIADAERQFSEAAAKRSQATDCDTVRAIVGRLVPPKFDFRFRTNDGKMWSEKWGRPVSRREFCA